MFVFVIAMRSHNGTFLKWSLYDAIELLIKMKFKLKFAVSSL